MSDRGIYILFKLKKSDENVLVYTTTPWTLPANVAIAVAPEETYVVTEVAGKKIILAEKRLEKLSQLGFGYSINRKIKGKELVGKEYEPLLNVPLQKDLLSGKHGKSHIIVASIKILKERVSSKMRTKKNIQGGDVFEEFVTTNEGTGLVHVAPGHGKTDNIVGVHYKLASVSPLDDRAHFTEVSGYKGFVKDADKDIIKDLEKDGKLLHLEQIIHSYPLCWRCKSHLIFRLSKQLFFKVDKVKKIIQKQNKKVKWYPEFARERFDNWVENAEDWNISRQRYWGTPIPVWRAEDGEEIIISNAKELEKLSGKKISDLHNVENLILKKNKKEFRKIKGILDVWFDSGVAPYASLGYPENNKKLFEENFPVSRINEAQDQIRGWFYSLMFCSAAVFEKPAYSEVSMTGWVLDKNGNKMSKSLGNVTSANDALHDLGADILRYYFCSDIAPYETQKFNTDIARKEIGKIFNVLWNLQNLTSSGKLKIKDIEDKWILSRLESMTKTYQKGMENFEFHTALAELNNFILNDLSRRYIQMTREKDNGTTISFCLERILKLLAPISPFISESIWQSLRKKNIVEELSVHLCEWPKSDVKKINSELESQFKLVFELIEKGLAERDKLQIGLKWPLSKAVLTFKDDKKFDKDIEKIIARQLNVKSVKIEKGEGTNVKLDSKMTPELEAEGYAREFIRNVQVARKNKGLKKEDVIELDISTEENVKKILENNLEMIKNKTNSKKIKFMNSLDEKSTEFTIKDNKISVSFS